MPVEHRIYFNNIKKEDVDYIVITPLDYVERIAQFNRDTLPVMIHMKNGDRYMTGTTATMVTRE